MLLRLEVESQPAQLAAQQRDIEAREAELGALRCKVAELEARDPIRLVLTGWLWGCELACMGAGNDRFRRHGA